ncbi:MAG: 4-hydroxy-tetrahydrodipicolinate reductase [Clostridia bacterium]|nr:4-hydroxy-tetrahydrodipicolinate reductase [Clostridia bacterium]MBR5767454.1 4-hydroxy-tetrahydrodipicolinate reductase [Clostridia bacterium]
MIKVIINGICGRMGREILRLAGESDDIGVVYGVDTGDPKGLEIPVSDSFNGAPGCDCVVDFSFHTATSCALDYALKNRVPIVIGTTGHDEPEKAKIKEAAKTIPVFYASNYSIGIALLAELAKRTAASLPGAEIEIVETHHDRKADAPSGTAVSLAEAIRETRPEMFVKSGRSGFGARDKNEIGINSVRIGNVVGKHEIIISTPSQTLTLTHEAHSRAVFAEGALVAVRFITGGMGPGVYGMSDMLGKAETV